MKFNKKNISIGQNVTIGKNVKIGDNSIIYDNVILEDGVIISNNCVIGEPLHEYYINENYTNPKTVIGKNSLIRSHSIIYAGTQIGENFQSGHFVTIREYTQIGSNSIVGTKCDIQGYADIGNYVRLHSYVIVGQKTKINNFAQIFPFTVFTNDPKPPSNELKSPFVDEYSVIASSCTILAGVKIGKHSLIGANSLVNSDVEEFSFYFGSPARKICDIRKLPIFTNGKRHYPWPYNFERGMPWEEMGFENWKEKND